MKPEVREIKAIAEIQNVIELQHRIWGFSAQDLDCPFTLKSMALDYPRMGFIYGLFLADELIGFTIIFPTRESDTVYGHMLGVLAEYRDQAYGEMLTERVFAELRRNGIRRMMWTFEPLEGRNGHFYLNKLRGKATRYHSDYIVVDDVMNRGLPIDRFICEVDLSNERPVPTRPLKEALKRYPVATEFDLPDAEALLVEIPGDLQQLKKTNLPVASAFRFCTRKLFEEYINDRGYHATAVISGSTNGSRRNFYYLERGG